MGKSVEVKRGDVFFINLDPVVGSEQGGQRPAVIIQNNVGNRYSPTVIVAPVTARISKPKMPTHVALPAETKLTGVNRNSVILCEQIRTIDKQRLQDKIGMLPGKIVNELNKAIAVSVSL